MELDQDKFTSCKADGSIEKPFETNKLRALVKTLVPYLSQNEISDHLVIENPIFEEDEKTPVQFEEPEIPELRNDLAQSPDLPPLDPPTVDNELEDTDVEFEDEDDYLASSDDDLNLPDVDSILKGHDSDNLDSNDSDFSTPEGIDFGDLEAASDEISDDWMEQANDDVNLAPEGLDDVDSFSVAPLNDSDALPFESPSDSNEDLFSAPEGLDLPPTPNRVETFENTDEPLESSAFNAEIPNEDESEGSIAPATQKPQTEITALKSDVGSETENNTSQNPPPLKTAEEVKELYTQNIPELSKEELKRLILAQSKDIIESVVWDVVPELAKEMIQKEIQRLTGEVKYEGNIR